MSAAPVEEFEVEDLDAAGVLEAAAEAEQAERRAALMKLRLAYQWAIMQPRHRRDRGRDPRRPRPRRAHHRGVPGRGRHPGGGGVHPRTLRVEARHLPRRRGPADRRRPRPTPPPPAALETPRPVAGAAPGRPAGSPNRPTTSRWSAPAGSTNDSPPAPTAPSAPSSPTGWSPLAVAKYDPEEQEQREDKARASSDVKLSHPDPTLYDGCSDLAATGDTLTLKAFYDLVVRHRPPAPARRRHRPPRGPQDQGHRPDHRPRLRPGRPRRRVACPARQRRRRPGRSGSPCSSRPTTSTPTPRAGPRSRSAPSSRLGAATMAKLRQWVGHHQVEILPVLNMAGVTPSTTRPTGMDARARRSSATATASSPAAPSPPRTATWTTRPPTSRSRKADHPDKPTPTPSPACAGDTTAPKPPASGAIPARPKATTSGTDPTTPPTSSPTPAPTASDHERSDGLLGEGAATWGSPTPCRHARTPA